MAKDTFQFNVKQFMGDDKVLGMEWDARGMHLWLLCISTQQKPPGSLPNDESQIRRWLGLSRDTDNDTWRRVRPQLFAAWHIQGDHRVNEGMVQTFERKALYGDRSKKGWNQRGSECKTDANDMQTPCKTDNSTSISESIKDLEIKNLTEDLSYESLFTVTDATGYVFLELGLGGIKARSLCQDAVKAIMHHSKLNAKQSAEELVSRWKSYESKDIRYKSGVLGFFEKGLWRDPTQWERRNESGQTDYLDRIANKVAKGAGN